MKAENYDVVIIGSGVAALICALTLDDSINICLITKKELKDSNSYLAQGGISVCRGKEDREDYIEDTLIAGHYKNNTCLGIVVKNKEIFSIKSKFTVLATGGIGGIYKNTTNFSHIRGDGIAAAIRHNIELKDISYVQIHPTTFYTKDNERKFLISDIEKRFPNIYKQLIKKDINVLKDKVPVVPAQHYTMGGIKVNMDSKTSMKNLYAVGEVACTSVHGQNRLASNSLLESVVFGKRAARSINVENNVSNYNNVTADNAFKNIEKEVFEIENKIKENKNIIEQRIKEDEFEKNR